MNKKGYMPKRPTFAVIRKPLEKSQDRSLNDSILEEGKGDIEKNIQKYSNGFDHAIGYLSTKNESSIGFISKIGLSRKDILKQGSTLNTAHDSVDFSGCVFPDSLKHIEPRSAQKPSIKKPITFRSSSPPLLKPKFLRRNSTLRIIGLQRRLSIAPLLMECLSFESLCIRKKSKIKVKINLNKPKKTSLKIKPIPIQTSSFS